MQLRSRIFQWAHSDRVAAFAGLPGPQPKFPLGNLGTIQRQGPVDVAADVAQNHGPLAVLWIKKQPLVLISDERLARAVLAQGRDTFVTALPDALLGLPLSGDARLAEEGFGHGDIYRHGPGPISLLQPSWITGWLAECTPMVQAHLAERVEAFARETQAGPQPLFAALLRVVFQTLTRLTLGQELSHQAFDDMLELCLGPQRRTLGFEPLEQRENLYGTPRERLLEAIGKHISMAVRYPDENRRDLIGYLLEGRYALAESEWAPAFLRILEGACLPVAAQLTQSFALLAGHPDALEALEHEIDAADAEPSAYTLRNLPRSTGSTKNPSA
ncbi:MAG: hypothetical protein R3F17_01040 [Planctomycetota bacterium]